MSLRSLVFDSRFANAVSDRISAHLVGAGWVPPALAAEVQKSAAATESAEIADMRERLVAAQKEAVALKAKLGEVLPLFDAIVTAAAARGILGKEIPKYIANTHARMAELTEEKHEALAEADRLREQLAKSPSHEQALIAKEHATAKACYDLVDDLAASFATNPATRDLDIAPANADWEEHPSGAVRKVRDAISHRFTLAKQISTEPS